jgi:hypothetical protein
VGAGGSAAGTIGGSAAGSAAGGSGPVTRQPWPSSDAVVAVDAMGQFPENLSDLVYQPAAGGEAAVLWAIQNDPPVVYCLLWNGTTWTAMTEDNWNYGKMLRYPVGNGSPDAEGVTRAEWTSNAIYAVAERDNAAGSVSRMSVLRYDLTTTGGTLTATHEWNLTPDLPTAAPNVGLEGITWVPDTYLVTNGLWDEATNAAYDPSRYPGHGSGLFFVGLEMNGMIYGYALEHDTGAFTRVTSVASGLTSVMGLVFDRDQGNLWAYCDNTCTNEAAVLRVSAGQLTLRYLFDHPATLPNSNHEGAAIAPESECVSGRKSFFWSDDDDFGGHAIYRGSIPCGSLP